MSRTYHNKPWDAPSKSFKQQRKSQRKAKERQALRTGKDIPNFKHSDRYDWT